MFNRIAIFLLTLTSIAPVLIIYGLTVLKSHSFLSLLIFGLSAILIAFCLRLLYIAKTKIEIEPLNIQEIKNANSEILAFFVTYLLPLLAPADNKIEWYVILAFAILLIIIIFQNNMIHVNPLIGLFGYQFFEALSSSGHTYLIITKNHTNKLNGRQGVRLSPTLILEV